MDDQLLAAVKDCQNGNAAAFGIIYDTFIKKIYNYLYFRTRHKEMAEDLTSVTFTKAYKNISSFRPESGTLQAWLYRIARNTLIDHYRTSKPTSDIGDAENFATRDDVEGTMDNNAELEKVFQYLNKLPKEHKDLVVMRVWDEMSYKEIAEVTGKSPDALKMSVSRILTKLRAEIAVVLLVLFTLYN